MLVTVIGLMVAAVTQVCQFTESRSCIAAPDYVIAASPTIPIALLAYATFILVLGTLRSYYMRGLENEIRTYLSAPISSLGDLMPASYMGVVQEVASFKRGRFLYRLMVYLMLFIIILIFGGYTSYVAIHVSLVYQILMLAVYGGIAILFVWQVALASVSGRTFFKRAARDFLNNRPGTALPQIRTGEALSAPRDGRTLLAYLIFPRPEDWVKWLISPGVFVVVAWSSNDLSRWPTFVGLWLVLEYLIYEARYQWNDVRGVDEDSSHSARRERLRLPSGPADRTRRNILISLAVAAGRLIVALVVGEALGLLRPVLVLTTLVLSIAIVYEGLRSLRPSSTPARPTPAVLAIWCLVGLGYGIRAGLGLIVGGLSATSSLMWIGVSCFVLFGIMFVLLTWVLEAVSCCYVRQSDEIWRIKRTTRLKPHLMALLRYVPIQPGEPDHSDFGDEEDGSSRPVLIERGRVWTPWNLALVASAALGAVLGVGLAHVTPGYLPTAIVTAVSVVAAALLTYCRSQQARIMTAGITAVVLVSAISPFGRWPLDSLAAGPWLMISALYVVFRGSSYRDLKEFGPNLLRAVSSLRVARKLGPMLLHVVIGDRAWFAAGFSGRGRALKGGDVVVPHQAASSALGPADTGGTGSGMEPNRSRDGRATRRPR